MVYLIWNQRFLYNLGELRISLKTLTSLNDAEKWWASSLRKLNMCANEHLFPVIYNLSATVVLSIPGLLNNFLNYIWLSNCHLMIVNTNAYKIFFFIMIIAYKIKLINFNRIMVKWLNWWFHNNLNFCYKCQFIKLHYALILIDAITVLK